MNTADVRRFCKALALVLLVMSMGACRPVPSAPLASTESGTLRVLDLPANTAYSLTLNAPPAQALEWRIPTLSAESTPLTVTETEFPAQTAYAEAGYFTFTLPPSGRSERQLSLQSAVPVRLLQSESGDLAWTLAPVPHEFNLRSAWGDFVAGDGLFFALYAGLLGLSVCGAVLLFWRSVWHRR